ncbi:hypothetical protein Y032_0662g1286 [Ancylostoma ceylanicum]|uniref:Uncharacterized protein n=1 Tax=Ancylostoma ceylanicum TaxID=53326 RepID=A0A016WHL5_9BILA|nr:hypothetical protein Y032_0662g1286 [Ancylostoma ceylanicum]
MQPILRAFISIPLHANYTTGEHKLGVQVDEPTIPYDKEESDCKEPTEKGPTTPIPLEQYCIKKDLLRFKGYTGAFSISALFVGAALGEMN